MEITKVILTYQDTTTVTYEVGVATVERIVIGPRSGRLIITYPTYKLQVSLVTVSTIAIYES